MREGSTEAEVERVVRRAAVGVEVGSSCEAEPVGTSMMTE